MEKHRTKLKEIFRAVLLVGGFAMSAILAVTDVPSIVKGIGIPLGLFLFFASVVSYLISSEMLWFWSQPDISISTNVADKYSDGKFYKSIQLQVRNNEEHPISDCYATLEYAAAIYILHDQEDKTPPLRTREIIPTQTQNVDRIKWEDVFLVNGKCEIEIPATYPRNLDLADSLHELHFNLCNNNLPVEWLIGAKLHVLKIRIDGRFANKGMKPKLFDGYIYSDKSETIFEEGNWRNDKRIDPALRNEA